MMTDEDKNKIREEEIFRAEVQKTLVSARPNKVIVFLNTSLGIWLLSTLVIGLFGWGYSRFQSSRQNEEQIIKLDREILARIESTQYRISNLGVPLPSNIYPANELLAPPTPERIVQTEFANRNFRSLLYELQSRVPVSEQEPILIAITSLQSIETEFLNKPASPEQVKDIFDRLSHLKTTRWHFLNILGRESAFYNQGNWVFLWVSLSVLLLLLIVALLSIARANKKTATAGLTSGSNGPS